jgi:hypothetical protein
MITVEDYFLSLNIIFKILSYLRNMFLWYVISALVVHASRPIRVRQMASLQTVICGAE